MLGGLKNASSRIAIAAALGFALGGYAMSTPAKAADFGGDCCADLEERVAELEATTVRKGNKKVSVTLSGWVVKSLNYWDDGSLDDVHIGDKDADLTSRFAITGNATIAPGWSGGYNITVTVPGDFTGGLTGAGNNFGILSNQFAQDSGLIQGINTLYSYMYLKSDNYGTINWGYLSPASDNTTFLTDLSGTVIETNPAYFEGGGFFLRPKGGPSGLGGVAGTTWGAFLTCSLVGGIGADCYGAPQSGVRYDSPTFGGFRLEGGYSSDLNNLGQALVGGLTVDVWDIAAIYNGEWGNFKVSAAYSFTHANGTPFAANPTGSTDLHQVGATVMHAPSGLGIYGYYQNEDLDANFVNFSGQAQGLPSSDVWYLKPFIKRTWNPLGATVLFGEYGQYNDQYSGVAGASQCAGLGLPGTNIGAFCGAAAGNQVFVTGSEIERWGLGVVQEIDSAAMHLFARWQHQDIDIDFVGTNAAGATTRVNQGFEDWDLIQLGGIIFF